MARYDDMLTDLRGAVYGAPDPILLRALKRATQELCKRSQCWRETLEDTYAQDGVGTYEFMAPFESVVDKVIHVKLGGKLLRYSSRPDELLQRPSDASGRPCMWSQAAATQELMLWPTPGADDHNAVISVYAVLSPTQRSTELPDMLVDEYGQGIVAQAKYELLMNSPGMPWHNPAQAQQQERLAADWFARAKRAQHSGHSQLLTVQPRRFV